MKVKMLCKTTLLLVKATLLLASCVALLSVVRPANAQTYSTNAAGKGSDGLLWTFYRLARSTGNASITLGANGNYSGSWSNFGPKSPSGNFTMGKGWTGDDPNLPTTNPTANAISNVGYNVGSYSDTGQGSVSVYGFVNADSTHSRVEFYIVERWNPSYAPPGTDGSLMSSNVTIGEGNYNIYKVNKGTFLQYFSVRTTQAGSGNHTVPVNQHFAKWNSLGMTYGPSRQYLYLSTESLYQPDGAARGSVNATVWGW